jgi:hypothetical protein
MITNDIFNLFKDLWPIECFGTEYDLIMASGKSACFLLGVFFDPEDGADMSL